MLSLCCGAIAIAIAAVVVVVVVVVVVGSPAVREAPVATADEAFALAIRNQDERVRKQQVSKRRRDVFKKRSSSQQKLLSNDALRSRRRVLPAGQADKEGTVRRASGTSGSSGNGGTALSPTARRVSIAPLKARRRAGMVGSVAWVQMWVWLWWRACI